MRITNMIQGEHMNDLIIHSKQDIAASAPITEDIYRRFIAFIDAKPKTIETYTRAVRRFFAYMAEQGITRPQRDDVIAFREALKATRKPTTVQSYIIAVRMFFRWTEQEGIYPNIADKIKGAKLDRAYKKDYLTSRQVKEVLAEVDHSTIQGLRDYAILALMVTGGLRDIEVSRADISDLRAVGDITALFIQGKGRDEKTEYVKIQPKVEKAIRAYLKARNADHGPLFTSSSNRNKDGRLSTRSISGIVKGRLQAAGYNSERLTAHSLRHTAVTLSLLGGRTLQETQQFARHSNISTTQIYAQNLDRAKNKCEETIAQAIF
jgi:integrase/recombinase XerD